MNGIVASGARRPARERGAGLSRPRRGRPRERGAGLWLLAAGLLLLSGLVAVLFVMVGLQMTAHRVQGAADLVAIAAAQAKNKGTSDACAAAGRQASASAVTLVSCQVAGDELAFAVTVRVRGGSGELLFGIPLSAEAGAHAGVDHTVP